MRPFCNWELYADSLSALKSLGEDDEDHLAVLELFLDARTVWLKHLVGSLPTDASAAPQESPHHALADIIRTLQCTVFDTVAIFVQSETGGAPFGVEPDVVCSNLDRWLAESLEVVVTTVEVTLSQVLRC